ncbi:subunit 13 of transcription initiation factor TFIID [Chloropicon primus]|uniref:Transcription initiation factor TFIID subunit 13 n=2 Tax=Chloropicon primus TaxID=1764295 RepID=A0A5B8MJ14_9CHLO|nr:subunit 13 of transcription initiation factor TFIID [Chloropicon primus]UPQ99829.1 subunit 13 of transcription initiation factor TFIID [Chloropicon primus]|eukprot:QDZ20618.1 subunit 13 of transcription initiation factor TFIID [Chloropicon primus]
MNDDEKEQVAEIVKDVRQSARFYRYGLKRKKEEAKDKAGAAEEHVTKQLKGTLAKCLPQMMYGFGDHKDTEVESVAYLESLVFERIASLAARCVENSTLGQAHGKAKVTAQDLLFEIRKDKRKHRRCKELLRLNEEIKQSKKSFEKPEMLEDGK